MSENQSIPKHVAIIMDGNGRWAKNNNLPNIAGHRAGADVAMNITECAAKMGISYITLYTFSSENWKRDEAWLKDFFALLKWYFEHKVAEMHSKNIRLKVIGDISTLPNTLQTLIHNAIEKTKDNTYITVVLALSYSGRDEIIRATQKILKAAKAENFDAITADNYVKYLDTCDIPDPDLLIRTSGEKRISNYLLWQMAYTEFVFTDVYWPDFTENDFEKALYDYASRERRYGKDAITH